MKKIVGMLTAAAVLATSVFAADVSAGVRLNGSLFNYDAAKKTMGALSLGHENQNYHLPISFSVSDENAGATLMLRTINTDEKNSVEAARWQIWFKPVDILKVNIGYYSNGLNQEHIAWCNSNAGVENDGYALALSTNGFSLDVFLASGYSDNINIPAGSWENQNYKPWFKKVGDGDATIGELYTKVAYAADFGTIMAELDATNNFKNLKFGAGYNFGSMLPVGLWFNVLGYYGYNEFEKIRVEADVTATLGTIGWELFVAGGFNPGKGHLDNGNTVVTDSGWKVGNCTNPNKAFVGFYTRFNIPVDSNTFYVELKDTNLLVDDFSMLVKPGFITNIGPCNIEVAVEFTAQKDIKIAVPATFKVSF